MNMLEIGVLLKLTDQMSGGMRSAVGSLDAFGTKLDRIAEKANRLGRASLANGMIATGIMEKPIKAFADLDEASTNLRIAMMNNLGQIPPQFAEINKQAIQLGNLLPGTTADFTNAATALLEQGAAIDSVVNGGLKAASYLSVILKMVPEDAAEMVAKFREAYGLSSTELTKMADLTQKAKFAFGLNPDDIKYAAAYSGSTLNQLGLTGVENAKKMLVLQGYARQQGMDGSVFGTNFAQMLNQIGQMQTKLQRHSLPMRQTNAELAKFGIHLNFFDKKGKFEGIENLVAQMQKLRVLSQQEQLFVTNRLFGMEGGRVAAQMVKMGSDGLQSKIDLMEKQADIMQRIDVATKSAKNTWEALTGTVTNLLAAFGGPLVDFLKPYITKLNEITGGPLQKFVDDHKTLARVVGLGALAFGGLAIAIGGAALALAAFSRAGSVIGGVLGLGKGKKGAMGAGIGAGMPIPLPVFVVNQHMSLTPEQMGGMPSGGVSGEPPAKGVGSKIAKGVGGLLGLTAAWEIGQGIGGGFNWLIDKGTSVATGGKEDSFGGWLYDKTHAKEIDRISHRRTELSGTLHIKIDSDGRPSVVSVKSSQPGVNFNAYAGNTMVTQ